MDPVKTVKRYQRIGAWIGALLVGGLFLLVSCLQPIDGVPGYRWVTKEDPSILWGFALSFVVGAVVGSVLGIMVGGRLGRKAAEQQVRPVDAPSPQPAGGPAFKTLAPPYAAPPGSVEEEFVHLFSEQALRRAEEFMSKGAPLDHEAIAQYATNRAAEVLMARHHLDKDEMVRIIERYFENLQKNS